MPQGGGEERGQMPRRWDHCLSTLVKFFIAAAASEPEANERGSSLFSRRLHYRGLQSLFLTKRKGLWICANESLRMRSDMRKKLWLCANGRFRMRGGMPQEIVVMYEWADLGCAEYLSHG